MAEITVLLSTLNTLSPLAVIAILALVLFFQVKNTKRYESDFELITDNHLHDLPGILEALQRMELANASAFATIIAKLNGTHK